SSTGAAGSSDGSGVVRLHRPERVWPVQPAGGAVQLAAPPAAPDPYAASGWLTVAPLLGSLGVLGFVVVVRSLVFVVVAVVMVVVMVGGSLAAQAGQRRAARRRREAAGASYRVHLAEVAAQAEAAARVQRDGLVGLYPDTAGALAAVREHAAAWERRPADADFAHVRLGLGPVPAGTPVLATGDTPLASPEPDLAQAARDLVEQAGWLADAPVVVPLRTLSSVALVGPPAAGRALAGAWLAALGATCAPSDLRWTGLLADPGDWEWLKWFPHARDPLAGDGFARARRAFTTDPAVLEGWLRRLVSSRQEQARRAADAAGWRAGAADGPAVAGEHVVVLVDGYDPDGPLGASGPLETLLAQGRELAVTVVVLVEQAAEVPSTCGATVVLGEDGLCSYREAGPRGRLERGVRPDAVDAAAAEALGRALAPLRVADADAGADLVDAVRLVELLGYDEASQVDPQAPDARLGPGTPATEPGLLATPIGIRGDGAPVVLDLKESAAGGMGPHGVLVGATGSGKSELLRSLVAGLAARHDPGLLNFVLVDFKGGAAFSELARLPHTAGLITNLADDLTLVDRTRAALSGELERRQQVLREAGNLDSIGQLHRARAAGDPAALAAPETPYLLVVVDEFGELLSARPEFLDTFVAIGRLGRSLGMHLLLATQRLEEGRIRGLESHLRYRLCLRTFSAAESQAVLGSPEAFSLPSLPGLGYLKVDTGLLRFKGATTTLPYLPPPTGGTSADMAFATAFTLTQRPSPTGRPRPTPPGPAADAPGRALAGITAPAAPSGAPGAGERSELEVLVDRLAPAGAPARPVWLPPLPDALTLARAAREATDAGRAGAEPLRGEPASAGERAWERVVVGLVDDPARQSQRALALDLTGAGGHVAVVGSPRTGRSTFLRTFALSLVTGGQPPTTAAPVSPARVQLYVMDLGGSLHDLAALPQVGAVAGRHDPAALARLLRELRATVDERAAALRAAGLADVDQLRRSPRRPELLPDPLAAEIFLLVDNLGALRSELPDLDLELTDLATTALQFGVHVVLTANRWLDVRPALLDAVGTRLELRLNDPVDSLAGRAAAAAVPERRPGRGLLRDGRHVQVALPSLTRAPRHTPGDGEQALLGEVAQATIAAHGPVRAPRIAPLPGRVTVSEIAASDAVSEAVSDGLSEAASDAASEAVSDGLSEAGPERSRFLLGVEEFRLAPVSMDLLAPGQHLLVFGDGQSGRSTLLRRAVAHLAASDPEQVRLHLVDLGRSLLPAAQLPHVEHYAFTASLVAQTAQDLFKALLDRLPPPDLPLDRLGERGWWSGPEHVLVVDDYDLTLTATGGPLGQLAEAVAQARDVGFHVLLTRRVAGAVRTAFEPFGQRLRETTPTGLILSGDRAEGALLGERTAERRPAGRGLLVRRGQRDTLVQLAVDSADPARTHPGDHTDHTDHDGRAAGERAGQGR
ncbi:MAG TPA: type VII secretion protein EccCa, partial [Motilibacteraceae bacterium]|nr:type VII secretion protein EccCa [Motilibacteraceae bacterium]